MGTPQLIGTAGDTLREAFGRALADLMVDYPNVVVLDADVAGGTGTHHVRKRYPERFYQIGIAEQNMMGMAAGMAATGLVPVVTTFAVFGMRAYEIARLSIAYPRRNVKIVCSHPGLDTGPDGASAQAFEDLGLYTALANMTVVSPADPVEVQLATRAILDYDGPVYMRTGRSAAKQIFDASHRFVLGKGQLLRDGSDITLIGCGVQTARCLEAAELLTQQGFSARVVNMPTLKPIDSDLIVDCARQTGAILTSEDHNVLGGLGVQVAKVLAENMPVPMTCHGIQDTFGESGEAPVLSEKYGLTAPHIARQALELLTRKRSA